MLQKTSFWKKRSAVTERCYRVLANLPRHCYRSEPIVLDRKRGKMSATWKWLLANIVKFTVTSLVFSFCYKSTDAQRPPSIDYSKLSSRPSPDWVRDGVIYEIFPRVFSPKGDFNGVTARLDQLKDLGVNILWLMPIHPVGRLKAKGTIGSPYAVKDYFAINQDYGTAADLKRLVSEAHKRGLKVIIDIVANHTSWDSVMMKTPAFYTHDASGKIIPPMPDWSDVADLNYDNAPLRRYMIDMLKYWIREFDLDGFRCDAAGMVPTDFWEQARTELDALKPGLLMLAEWDNPALMARAFDVDYAWKGYAAVADAIQGRA